ncbi:MAG: hydroxysqualene dehydroxylase HpnE [Vicinamibacterales bacterium]
MTSPDVIVVGAGFAGLAAATALVERGARVLVLEARPVLGGRASAVRDAATGEKLDNGQHVLMGCYEETFRFLTRIGALDKVRRQAGLAITMIERGGRRSTLQLPPLPAPLHLMAGVLAWDALSWSEKVSVMRVGAAVTGREHPTARGSSGAPGATVNDWLVAHGQAARLIELFWEPLALAALNQPIAVAAADTFIEVLSRMFGPEAERASLVVPAVPLDEMYAEPARAWLERRGSEVRAQSPARVRVEGGRVTGVDVRGEPIDAPVVIAAVPWFALPALFPPPAPIALDDLLRRAAATASSPIVTVNLWYDRPVLDEMLVGLPGRAFQWVFDKGVVFGRERSHLSLVSSGAADIVAQSNEELAARAAREVHDALPRAAAARLVHASAVRERRATFSLAPGQPTRPGTETGVTGLLLAGDWVDTGLPATIEGAVVSGHRAADVARH